MKLRLVAATGLALVLGGCGKSHDGCSADGARDAIAEIMRQKVERVALSDLRRNEATQTIGLDRVRAATAQITAALEDVRTDKSEFMSSKADCSGTLRLKIGTNVLNDAFSARQSAHMTPIDELAEASAIDHKGDSYAGPITYHVQPTDDGQKTIARLDDGATLFAFVAEVVASAAARPVLDQQHKAEMDAKAASDTALAQQRAATLNAAQVANKSAVQDLGRIWANIPLGDRQRLAPEQKAWIRKKDADCLVEAANATANVGVNPGVGVAAPIGAPVDPAAAAITRQVVRLVCDTRAQEQRARWLQQFAGMGGGFGGGENQPR